MDNTEKPINDECACSIDYEAAYHNAMRELNAMWEENKSLRIVVRELSKILARKDFSGYYSHGGEDT